MYKCLVYKFILAFVLVLLTVESGFCQEDTAKAISYDDLSLKDLLNVKISSVSKKTELLFDAPLSASVITREDIRKAGSTSIMEALRLVPGLIVREQTNGTYDIHLRGMDNVPPNSIFDGNATTTLVMLDNRPIYNYLKGGTFWETLPIDLNDVEKIEIVRGPSAALYGPNAVSGVINIITRKPEKQGLYLLANARQGSHQTYINNASLGYKFEKWSILASGNYQYRNRVQTSYFEIIRNRWIEDPSYLISILGDTVTNISEMYPKQELAIEEYGGNVFINYESSERTKLNLTAGSQHSMVQTVSTDNGNTPLTTVVSDSKYADLKLNVYGFAAQASYNTGTQIKNLTPGNKYDFQTLDANLEYNYTKGQFSLKPQLSYRSALYDDTKYSDIINKTGIFNARGKITTQSASVKAEYKVLNEKLRLVTGLAASKFNYPDSTYLSYQFAATYKAGKKQLLRAVFSQAPRSSTIYDAYSDQTIAYFQTGVKRFYKIGVEHNKNLKLLVADMLELGYRGKIASNLSIDIEIFKIKSKNYNSLVVNREYMQLVNEDTLTMLPYTPTNLPMTLRQLGITVSLQYNFSKVQVRPFATLQQSKVKNYAPFLNMPDAPATAIQGSPELNNIFSGIDTEFKTKGTPTTFGGLDINYLIHPKLNCNLNTYYYSKQTYSHVSNIIFNDGIRGIDHINAKLIVNANLTYEPVKGVHISCTAKNILNDDSREFFRADNVPFMLLAGLNYEF